MSVERFDFIGGAGQTLSGRLDRPIGPARAFALFAHCFACSKDVLAARRISRALALRGVAVLRFDFTGLGESDGAFGATGFTGDVADLVAAGRAMTQAGMPPSLLVGHSLGGAAVLAAAGDLPSVIGVATIAAPFDPGHVKGLLGGALPALIADGQADIEVAGRQLRLRRSFLDGLAHPDQAARIGHLHRALLILHAPLDQVVGIDNAEAIWLAARHPKSFVSLDTADHLLTRTADADYVAGVVAAWSARYLPPALDEAPLPGAVAEPTEDGVFQTLVTAGGQHVVVDEPVSIGGRGQGPTPFGLLCGALAACTAMTIRMHARSKGWDLPRLRVEVTHDKVSAEERPRDRFTRKIIFLDRQDEAHRAVFMAAAERCPVHQALQGIAHIETQGVEAAPPE